MQKSIKTLVADIYGLFDGQKELSRAGAESFVAGLSRRVTDRFSRKEGPGTLRLSNLGSRCQRRLWYSVNQPELAEPLPPAAKLKFLFGDILEELLLWLAREAGHTVEREQEEVDLYGVKGHIDGVIDGHLVDCKSASPYSFKKFKSGTLHLDDPFGYITQLDAYLHSTIGVSSEGSFLVIDKTLGHICLDTYEKSDRDYELKVAQTKNMLAFPQPPARGYTDEPDGKSGNRRLSVSCSYCPFKQACWPGVRTFLYSGGPVFLTEVRRLPNVMEIKDAVQEGGE